MAMPYHDTLEPLGGDLYVRKATLEYLGSARYDDQLEVGIRTARIGNSSINLVAGVFRGEAALVTGDLVYVFADPATQTSRPVPQPLRDWLDAFEAGEAMVDVRLGGWSQLGRDAQALRTRVFVEEQGIPVEIERDARDEGCLHAVAYNRMGLPVGAARLVSEPGRAARVGRMAVRADLRGSGVGSVMLAALTQAARERGHAELLALAQESALGFWRRSGYRTRGERHDVAGVPHTEMALTL
jgi:predicted GNAT family N-acyltransferase